MGGICATRMKTLYVTKQWMDFHLFRNFAWKKFVRSTDEGPEVG